MIYFFYSKSSKHGLFYTAACFKRRAARCASGCCSGHHGSSYASSSVCNFTVSRNVSFLDLSFPLVLLHSCLWWDCLWPSDFHSSNANSRQWEALVNGYGTTAFPYVNHVFRYCQKKKKNQICVNRPGTQFQLFLARWPWTCHLTSLSFASSISSSGP